MIFLSIAYMTNGNYSIALENLTQAEEFIENERKKYEEEFSSSYNSSDPESAQNNNNNDEYNHLGIDDVRSRDSDSRKRWKINAKFDHLSVNVQFLMGYAKFLHYDKDPTKN